MRTCFYLAATGLMVLLLLAAGCSHEPENKGTPEKKNFTVKSLAKSDIDSVLDTHIREMRNNLRELMIKLYKRNPRELAKSGHHQIEKNVARIFDEQHDWKLDRKSTRLNSSHRL